MTLAELKAYIATQLVAPVTLVQKVINCFYAVVDFITQSDNSGIPAWTNALTFNTDGTGDGSFCTYVDVAGNLRFWKTVSDGNINHAPPTAVGVTFNTYWIEVSPANGSAIKEWAPGVYGEGLIIVFYDLVGDGSDPALYKLNEATRPFNSTNIITEIAANKWQKMLAPAETSNQIIDCGEHDASTDLFPTTGGTGAGGAIKRGNQFDITVAGTLGGVDVEPGATIRARVDAPAQVLSNWRIYY